MTWVAAAPALGAAVVLLLGPGALVVAVSGVRGVLAAALVPVLSVAVVAGGAVVASAVGMPFGPLPVLGATVAAAAAVGLSGAFARRWGGTEPPADTGLHSAVAVGAERRTLVAGILGSVVGAAALAVGLVRGIGTPERWPQTFDAVFHLAAIDHVLRSADASALTLGALTNPERTHAFYPAAWHGLVALVASTTGVSTSVAANAVALCATALAWPLGCAALTRVAVGPRPLVVATAGLLAAALTASPVLLTAFGTVWPNALATALLPAVLALAADLTGLGPHRSAPAVTGVVLLAVAVVGLALAHPNAVVSLLVLGASATLVGTWGRGPGWRAASTLAGFSVAFLVLLSPAFDAQRNISWQSRQSLAQAVGEWLALAPQRVPVPFVVAVLALLGCVVAWRSPALRWLLAVHFTAGMLFVLVAGSDGPVSRLVSAPWWDDPFRLAALVGVAGVPLAAIGLEAAGRQLALAWRRPGRPVPATAMTVGLLACATVATGGLGVSDTADVVGRWYAPDSMLGPAEQGLLARVGEVVPAGERVVGNPWNGASLTGALGDREAVFPHFVGDWDADRELLARSLTAVATRPEVCGALARLRVSHVLVGPATFWADDTRREAYAGLEVAGHEGFTQVARSGEASLWRVTACDP